MNGRAWILDDRLHCMLARNVTCLLAVSVTNLNLPCVSWTNPMPLVKISKRESSEQSYKSMPAPMSWPSTPCSTGENGCSIVNGTVLNSGWGGTGKSGRGILVPLGGSLSSSLESYSLWETLIETSHNNPNIKASLPSLATSMGFLLVLVTKYSKILLQMKVQEAQAC